MAKWKVVFSKSVQRSIEGEISNESKEVEADSVGVCPMGGGSVFLTKGKERVFLAPVDQIRYCQVIDNT